MKQVVHDPSSDRRCRLAVSVLSLFLRVGTLLAAHVVLDSWFRSWAALEEGQYRQPFIFLELVKSVDQVAIFLAVVLLIRWFRGPAMLRDWRELEAGRGLWYLIVIPAAAMAWSFSTHGYNHYFDQGHFADRALLVGLLLLLAWRPCFVFPFSLLLLAMISQLNVPLQQHLFAVDLPIAQTLILFGAALLVSNFNSRVATADFLLITCCLVASNYWWPGVGKLGLQWFSHGHVHLILFGAYAHGWLAFLRPEQVVSIAERLAWFDWLLVAGTLLLECGALFSLARRRCFLAFLAGWLLFHLSTFALIGFCFWKWAVLLVCLWTILAPREGGLAGEVFTAPRFILSLLLIAGTPVWFTPARLAWYDTPLASTYRYQAISESGRLHDLPATFFSPYEDQMVMASFGAALHVDRQLVKPYGITPRREVADRLVTARGVADILALERQLGVGEFSPEQARLFDKFARTYIRNYNRNRGRGSILLPRPPRFLWTFPRGIPYRGQERLVRLNVVWVSSLYDGTRLREFRRRTIREVPIEPRGSTTDD